MTRGIAKVLRDYYELESRTTYGGDLDTALLLADIMRAINGDVLTERQRQVIALYYFAGLKLREIAYLLDVTPRNVRQPLQDALKRVSESQKNPKTVFKSRAVERFDRFVPLYKWLDDIADGAPVKEPPLSAVQSLADLLEHGDEGSAELVRQRREGFVYVDEDESEEYPHFSDAQLRWKDRRISLVEEVLPPGDAIGFQRYTPAPDYEGDAELDDDYLLSRSVRNMGRRKLFKLRGN